MAIFFIPAATIQLAHFLLPDHCFPMRYHMLRFLFALCTCCGCIALQAQQYHFLYRTAQQYTLQANDSSAAGPSMDSLLAFYRQGLQQKMQDTLACTRGPLTKAQPESTLGNLIADALLDRARRQDATVTAAILSYSSIGTSFIAPGPLTRQAAYDLLPHQDPVTILELNGQFLQQLCDTIARYNGWPLSGISFLIDSGRATQIHVAGAALNRHLRYRVAVNDFVTAQRIFRNAGATVMYKRTPAGFSATEALIFYLQQRNETGNCLHSELENRISYADQAIIPPAGSNR